MGGISWWLCLLPLLLPLWSGGRSLLLQMWCPPLLRAGWLLHLQLGRLEGLWREILLGGRGLVLELGRRERGALRHELDPVLQEASDLP